MRTTITPNNLKTSIVGLRPRIISLTKKNSPKKSHHKTQIMGIINATPDSFSLDGCVKSQKNTNIVKNVVALAKEHIINGADIIDLGGESTRPGSKRISLKEEQNRIIPALKQLKKETDSPISVDTYKSSIAKLSLDCGATIINNIKGVKSEKKLLRMVAKYDASIVLMHSLKTPRTMQEKISYTNIIKEIKDSFKKAIHLCLDIGINSDKIIIDPGFGFGKTVEHNLEILNRLDEFKTLKKSILIGTSRKSFIGKVLKSQVNDRLIGSITTMCIGVVKGASIVRVHDVKATKEALTMTDAVTNQKYTPKE